MEAAVTTTQGPCRPPRLHVGDTLLRGRSLEEPRSISHRPRLFPRWLEVVLYLQRDGEGGGSAVRCGTERIRRASPCRASGLGERGRTGGRRGCSRDAVRWWWDAGAVPAGERRALGGLQPKAELGLDENSLLLILFRGKMLLFLLRRNRQLEGRIVGFCRKTSQSSEVSHVAFCLFFPYRNSSYSITWQWHCKK